ncbi:MAG: pantetheine-phosphate adenylyltransferase [Corynebacterium sp.]|uniref:pantetheine-phosphate adenylyltransferase n=1 Tax=Corynebacterium sp. TaxID=1720 RepID=UPI0026DA9E08|nr:pantetheine-phosphate adenylyltransferase [Corynebacterium sp.]MDO4762354.1 pantetheine-phosphate adenylyltransferase [Corynebacterium sp.]
MSSSVHRAVCPGSFDPVTMGHVDIFRRAARQFDEVTVLVTGNPNKTSGLFTVDERLELLRESCAGIANLRVDWWSGLLVDYAKEHGISVIVKGLRSSLDYEYEVPMAQMNRNLSGVDTMFLMTDPKYGHVSSTLCKEVIRFGGDIKDVLPAVVEQAIKRKYAPDELESE